MTQKKLSLFEAFLAKNESRYTIQKKEIATHIFNTTGHFEIEDFIDLFRKNTRRLSRATVYRTIKQLLDAGLLQKISTRDGKVYYENSAPENHHAHVICNHCGNIQEIKDPSLNQFVESYCRDMKFVVEYQSLHVYGKCDQCQEN